LARPREAELDEPGALDGQENPTLLVIIERHIKEAKRPLGSTTLEEYGGAGLGYVVYGLIVRELERVDSSYRFTNGHAK
jgi:alkylation response protein AidB-like acyl-CoA dehydrogenase